VLVLVLVLGRRPPDYEYRHALEHEYRHAPEYEYEKTRHAKATKPGA
jgi:hypothetical protein